jgi:hypothetical protein
MIAVNIEVKIPIARVTANPRMGPDPKLYKKTAANKVVRLLSIIVVNAR